MRGAFHRSAGHGAADDPQGSPDRVDRQDRSELNETDNAHELRSQLDLRAPRDLRALAADWLARARHAIVIEVTRATGSAPRKAGTRMLVDAATAVGTIGGGHLELRAIEEARLMLASGDVAPRLPHYPLGPALGQCCGGAVTLRLASLDAEALADWHDPAPRFHLQLFGAGHVGRAIARALAPLNARIDWIDEREDQFPSRFFEPGDGPWPRAVRKVCVDAVEAEVRSAPPGAYFLVLTHQHDLDLRITEAILARADFGFLGLIGSKTKRQRFIRRFEARGIPPALIARMTCPIGLPGIEGKEPEVIAAAVAAQLLLVSGAAVAEARAGTAGTSETHAILPPATAPLSSDVANVALTPG